MTQSLTDWVQNSRLIVVGVDPEQRRVRVKGEAEACTDLACSSRTLVVTDEGAGGDLTALNAGDVVKIDGAPGRAERIVVVRRVWDELTSPEW